MVISFANEILTLILSWFLDKPELNWSPPKTLVDFMAKARSDDEPLVYIGFGSITMPKLRLVTGHLAPYPGSPEEYAASNVHLGTTS